MARRARHARQRARDVATTLEVELESQGGLDNNEEVHHARISKKRQRRATHAFAREQSVAVRAMDGLPLEEEKKEDGDGSDNSGS